METVTGFSTPEEAALDLELPLLGTLEATVSTTGVVATTFPVGEESRRIYHRAADRVLMSPLSRLGSFGLIGDVDSSTRAQTAAWLAASIASQRTAILIDADLRAAHLSFDDRGRAQEGLVDVLRYGVRSPRVVSPTQTAGLNLLPVGSGTVDFGGTYGSGAVPALFDELRRTGDLIVINGPDLGDFQSAAPFLAQVSSWILVHRLGESDPAKTRTLRATFGREKCLGLLVLTASTETASAEAASSDVSDSNARVAPAATVGASADRTADLILDSEPPVASPTPEPPPAKVATPEPELELTPAFELPPAEDAAPETKPELEPELKLEPAVPPAEEPPPLDPAASPSAEAQPKRVVPPPTEELKSPSPEEIAAWTEVSHEEKLVASLPPRPEPEPELAAAAVPAAESSSSPSAAPSAARPIPDSVYDPIDEIPPVKSDRRISPIFGVAVVAVIVALALFLMRPKEDLQLAGTDVASESAPANGVDEGAVGEAAESPGEAAGDPTPVAIDAATGPPATGTPATGTPATGTPATGTPAIGSAGASPSGSDPAGTGGTSSADVGSASTPPSGGATSPGGAPTDNAPTGRASTGTASTGSASTGSTSPGLTPPGSAATNNAAPGNPATGQPSPSSGSSPGVGQPQGNADSPPIPRAAPLGTTGRLFFVHTSSLKTHAAAELDAAKLKRAGLPTALRQVEIPERGLWWRVYLGPYGQRADAVAVAERVKADGLTDYTQIHRLLTSDVEVGTGQGDR